MKKHTNLFTSFIISGFIVTAGVMTVTASAEESSLSISGKVYELEESSEYSESGAAFEYSASSNTYGKLSLNGNIYGQESKNGIPAYIIKDDIISLTYSYNDVLLNAADEEWHIVDDGRKTVNDVNLDDKVKKGAVIVQTSLDGEKWFTNQKQTNVFAESFISDTTFYESNDIQLSNGCYYRITVAYETAIKTDSTQILFASFDNYEYKRHMEVYEFYAQYKDVEKNNINSSDKKFALGNTENTGLDKGFTTGNPLEIKDVHYGWELGNFFVSGYTEKKEEPSGEKVFLKNLGDKVTLYFDLKQNIDKLNGNDKLKISSDGNGYDQKFGITKTNFGKGALIIRYTDYEGKKHDPIIYTDYLESLASPGADNIVQLFEEGDYEVSLDYEIMKDELIDSYTNYMITFSFKIRNGNCMVYPFDLGTKAELKNSYVTENGFTLDLAKSRYLSINVEMAKWVKGASGYTEDIRFNRPAKDGDKYTDEGIYTIEVANAYTGKTTTKKIYVGSDSVMIAAMNPANESYSVNDIYELVNSGATINNDGSIVMPVVETTPVETEPPVTETAVIETTSVTTVAETTVSEEATTQPIKTEEIAAEAMSDNVTESNPLLPILIIVGIIAVGSIVVIIVLLAKKKNNNSGENK